MKQAKLVNAAERERVSAATSAHRYPSRNNAVFALSFDAGLRACEIAALRVGDAFDNNGAVHNTI